MKNTQTGFVGIAIIILVAIAAVGSGVYVYNKSDVKVSDNTDTKTNNADTSMKQDTNAPYGVPASERATEVKAEIKTNVDISNAQVAAALNADLVSRGGSKYQYLPQANGVFGVAVDSGFNKIENVYKGDINNDGYTDALVQTSSCSKGTDCAYCPRLVVGTKDGGVESVSNFRLPDTISCWSGGKSTSLDNVKIENGVVSITSSSFYSSGEVKSADKLPTQTKRFQLNGSTLVEIR